MYMYIEEHRKDRATNVCITHVLTFHQKLYLHSHVYQHKCTHTHTDIHMHIHAYACTCTCTQTHLHPHIPMHAHTIAHTYTQHMDHPTHTLRVCASAWWASIIVTLFSSGWTFNTTLPRQSVQPWLPFFASSTRQSSPTATSNISIHSATACSITSSP